MHPRLRCPGKTNAANEVGARWRHSSYVGRAGRNPSWLPCAMRWMPPADVYIWPPDMPVPPMRRRCRHSDWNGHFPSSTRTCASTALAPRRPIATVCTVASSAFSSAPRPKTMHRIWCRRRPATMKTCVGPKCLTPKDTACVSARPAANISRRACCRTARSCWKRRPTRTSCRRSVTRSCACWPRKWAWAATIHGARPSMSSTSCPPIGAYTLDVNLELF